jgi:renalase
VLTLPAPQALELLPEGSALTKPLQSVTYDPCLVAMVTMREASGLPFASATVEDPTDGLAWMANESSKPGRLATPERWVLHSDPAWARAHLEEDPLESARALCEAFRARTGAGEALEVLGHRWRYARVRDHLPEGQDFLWDESEQLGWVGDGAIGPRIESAYLSGRALARRLAR